MQTEVDNTETADNENRELTPEEQEAQDKQAQDDFAAGFNTASTGEEPALDEKKTEASEGDGEEKKGDETGEETGDSEADADTGENGDGDQEEEEEGASASEEEEEASDEDDDAAPVQITRGKLREFEAALERVKELGPLSENVRKLQGRFGELNDRMAKMGGPRKITKENLKKLSDEFPDLAGILADDLSGILTAGGGEGGDISDESLNKLIERIEPEISNRFSSFEDQVNNRVLNILSPGWKEKMFDKPVLDEKGEVKEVPFQKDFKQFLSTLTDEDRGQLLTSRDPEHVAAGMKKFDEWKVARDKKAKADADKKRRLERATQEKTGGSSANNRSTEEEESDKAFTDGFEEASGKR